MSMAGIAYALGTQPAVPRHGGSRATGIDANIQDVRLPCCNRALQSGVEVELTFNDFALRAHRFRHKREIDRRNARHRL